MSNSLNFTYTFYSPTSLKTYFLSLFTNNIAPIKALDGMGRGYLITSGNVIVVAEGTAPQIFPVPGNYFTGHICNALWPSAADSPTGSGTVLCQGIDRLFVSFSSETVNTSIVAVDGQHVSVVIGKNSDPAQLTSSTFPPTT